MLIAVQPSTLRTASLCHTDGKTAEATELYAPLVEKAEASDGLLHVTAISIANLCAAYILDGQNDKAEAIMHSVEEEERHALLKVSP